MFKDFLMAFTGLLFLAVTLLAACGFCIGVNKFFGEIIGFIANIVVFCAYGAGIFTLLDWSRKI